MHRTMLLSGVAVGLMIGTAHCEAQEKSDPHPLEPADTSSPRVTLLSFIDACNEVYDISEGQTDTPEFAERVLPAVGRVLDCLDLSSLPQELRDTVGIESAVYLKEVLDRIALPAEEEVPEATTAEGEPVLRWNVPGTRLQIIRVSEGPHEGQYRFSSETVRLASKFYSAAKSLPYREEGPDVSPRLYERYVRITKGQPKFSADTSSPRGTLTLFYGTTNEVYEIIRQEEREKGYFDRNDTTLASQILRILSCLDVSELPEYTRDDFSIEAAVCLKEVLDRVSIPPAEEIPGPENLQAAESGERLKRWQIPNTQITIVLIDEGPRRGEYLFSAETVKEATTLYAKIKEQPYRSDGREVSEGLYEWWLTTPGQPAVATVVDRVPEGFHRRIYGMAIWQWLGLFALVGTSLAVMALVYRIGHLRSEKTRQKSLLRYWATVLFAVVAMLIPLLFKHLAHDYLTLRGTALYVTNFAADLVFLLALIVVILAVSSRLADSVVALPSVQSKGVDATLIRILSRMLGLIAATIVFLEGGRYLGFPITTLLASAGIGGLAIALAAQGMVKGLFGTVTILLDRPYRVGDRILVKGQDGIVEEVGLRSTKIRTILTGNVVSIPNDHMAESEIENIGKRKHIRRVTNLHIPIDTPREQVEKAVEIIREALADHEGMDADFPPRIFFDEFNTDSFNIHISYWYSPPDLWSYYAFCEKVNLEIFRAFEEHGIQFSLPLRHSYWKTDDEQGPLDVSVQGNGINSLADGSGRTPAVAE